MPFGELIDHLLLKAQSDKFPDQDSKILIDISGYLYKTADKISDMSDIALDFEQVEGLSYQGLTHLQKYSGSSRDSYREEIMENTQKLYRMLPEKAIFQEGTTNPMQISAINDERIFFLDIKFPGHPKTMAVFQKLFVQYAKDNKLPLTSRPSFSFINSSLTAMSSPHGDKLRLNVGMEKVTVLKSYAKFFKKVQKALTLTKKELKRGNTDDLLASRLQQFNTRRL